MTPNQTASCVMILVSAYSFTTFYFYLMLPILSYGFLIYTYFLGMQLECRITHWRTSFLMHLLTVGCHNGSSLCRVLSIVCCTFLTTFVIIWCMQFFFSIDRKASNVVSTGCVLHKLILTGKWVMMWVTLFSISCFWN
jgi:uncharacterized membrane protein